MGQINKIKKDKKGKLENRLFMVSITFDVWGDSHLHATAKLADYLEWALTHGKPSCGMSDYKKPIPKLVFEATECDPKHTWSTKDDGLDIKI